MNKQDYNAIITANITAKEAFNCINRVSEWWTENRLCNRLEPVYKRKFVQIINRRQKTARQDKINNIVRRNIFYKRTTKLEPKENTAADIGS